MLSERRGHRTVPAAVQRSSGSPPRTSSWRSICTGPVSHSTRSPHFQEAHRLDPTNWSYYREALSLVDPAWGQVYERDMLSEVEAVGPQTFYPPLDM